MSYQNRVTAKEVGREHSMVAARRREAREREAALIAREAALPPMKESQRRQPVTHTAWVPKWMEK